MKLADVTKLRSIVSPLGIAAVACALTALSIVALSIVDLVTSATARTTAATAVAKEQGQLETFRSQMKRYEAQVIGRSPFRTPGKPREATSETVTAPTTNATKPSRYGGPAIVAMINNAVWFADGQRIAVGTDGSGVGVVSITPPWGARLVWQEAEFDVGLFERDGLVYRRQGAGVASFSPSAAAPLSALGTNSTQSPRAPNSVTPVASGRPGAAAGVAPAAGGAAIALPLSPLPPAPPEVELIVVQPDPPASVPPLAEPNEKGRNTDPDPAPQTAPGPPGSEPPASPSTEPANAPEQR